jgi:hypothetical protein
LTQIPCDLGAGEACDLAKDQASGTLDFACYPAPNEVPVGEVCDVEASQFCVAGATCVEGGDSYVCAVYCCSDAVCPDGTTCFKEGAYAPNASDLGVCL